MAFLGRKHGGIHRQTFHRRGPGRHLLDGRGHPVDRRVRPQEFSVPIRQPALEPLQPAQRHVLVPDDEIERQPLVNPRVLVVAPEHTHPAVGRGELVVREAVLVVVADVGRLTPLQVLPFLGQILVDPFVMQLDAGRLRLVQDQHPFVIPGRQRVHGALETILGLARPVPAEDAEQSRAFVQEPVRVLPTRRDLEPVMERIFQRQLDAFPAFGLVFGQHHGGPFHAKLPGEGVDLRLGRHRHHGVGEERRCHRGSNRLPRPRPTVCWWSFLAVRPLFIRATAAMLHAFEQ